MIEKSTDTTLRQESLNSNQIWMKVQHILSGNKEKKREKTAFVLPWDDDSCMALRTEIEAKPNFVDADSLVMSAYMRLQAFLGPHSRDNITIRTIRNRVVFTQPETIRAFLYLLDQPGENADKYWRSPIHRTIEVRGKNEATNIYLTRAITYSKLGFVMIPNDQPDTESMKKQLALKSGTDTNLTQVINEFSGLEMKRLIAHELVHLLYSNLIFPHYGLKEPIVDYIATVIFPEIVGSDVQYDWARAAVDEYMKILGYTSIDELIKDNRRKKEPDAKLRNAAHKVNQKYFSKLSYIDFGLSEDLLNGVGLSKYIEIPG